MSDRQIVVFSEENDVSTLDVMKYCKIAGCDVRRINSDDKSLSISISGDYVKVTTSFDSFDITKKGKLKKRCACRIH